MVTYAIRFDFPEARGPVFAGIADGALGYAPSLATALLANSVEEAVKYRDNGYGESVRQFARVVAVTDRAGVV